MKIDKGEAGYLRQKRKHIATITFLQFMITLGLFVFGVLKEGLTLNLFTIISAVVALPTLYSLTKLIRIYPYQSINEAREIEIAGKTDSLTVLFDLVIKCDRKYVPIRSVVISDNIVCGYTNDRFVKTDPTAAYIKGILEENGIEKVTVRILHDYVSFLSRAEGMQNIANIQGNFRQDKIEKIADLLKERSL